MVKNHYIITFLTNILYICTEIWYTEPDFI
jgi:hypothetical protein